MIGAGIGQLSGIETYRKRTIHAYLSWYANTDQSRPSQNESAVASFQTAYGYGKKP